MLKIRLGKRSKLGMVSSVMTLSRGGTKAVKKSSKKTCPFPLAWDNRKNEWYCPM